MFMQLRNQEVCVSLHPPVHIADAEQLHVYQLIHEQPARKCLYKTKGIIHRHHATILSLEPLELTTDDMEVRLLDDEYTMLQETLGRCSYLPSR